MQREFVESILANLQSGIIVVDPDYRIKMVNNYVAEFCGMPKEEFMEKNLAEISPELFAQIRSGQTAGELRTRFLGGEKSIGFNLAGLTDKGGIWTGHIINFRDMTEIAKIRNDLRHKERFAAIGEIVGKVAHEMRNPLFGITAVAQILEMELPLTESHKGLMDSLLREARRLNNLVEVLQECTREIRLSKKKIDLIQVIDASLQKVAALLRAKGLSLRQQHDREVWLSADAEKLTQVMIHLLTNAVEASAAEEEITLAVVVGEDGVVVEVTDQGHGILPENLEKIFDVFFTTRKNRSGLGLSFCRSIIAAHGGSLTASNNSKGGAKFTLQLPLGESRI